MHSKIFERLAQAADEEGAIVVAAVSSYEDVFAEGEVNQRGFVVMNNPDRWSMLSTGSFTACRFKVIMDPGYDEWSVQFIEEDRSDNLTCHRAYELLGEYVKKHEQYAQDEFVTPPEQEVQ
jgi:hypothetical protein